MKSKKITIAVVACLTLVFCAAGCGKLNPKTQGQIFSALEAKNADFQKCYEKALKKDRNVKGEVDLVLKFDQKGTKPEGVEIAKSTIKDDKMLKCVSKEADGIRIEDAPGVIVEGQYTVSFQFK